MADTLIVCKCSNCETALGSLTNEWIQVGKNYITSTQDVGHLLVAASGDVRFGDVGTLIAGCQLQVAVCAKCDFNLGQKCVKSPADHALNDGQVVFRVTSINLRLASDMRRKVAPNIKRVLNLKVHNDQPKKEQADASPETPQEYDAAPNRYLVQIQNELEAHRQQIGQIGRTGVYVVSNFKSAVARVDWQIRQLNESVDGIRSDADRQRHALDLLESKVADAKEEEAKRVCPCEAIVARLDKKLQDTDVLVTELRRALQKSQSESETLRQRLSLTREELEVARGDAATLRADADEAKNAAHESLAMSQEYACEVSSLRREVKQLQAQMKDERILSQPAPAAASFPSHELDILASSISKIGNRASQIESLQMEFDLFKTRLQRLEAARAGVAHSNRGGMAATTSAAADDENEPPGYNGGTLRRKRAYIGGREDMRGGFDKTSTKRAALSMSDRDSGISTGNGRDGEPYRSCSSGSTKATSLSGPRRSREDVEDYTAVRRESWSGSG
ncbi:hypothetical protein L249_5826 [Ophiocordyceps polyrhachis-furcata BCC 54312]|uniref:Yippee/Mis18/Cereblon domain-containing protein n=1 Tax=Ophiocordyceps polyrhachis-furcata BCC 54312 TaxID=1330021 RepID=A0A367L090_9HYPO|nr:hypothetical protein L249_5826 [Ophiocordyceps polyrhachis-furcata BCC 54312]